MLSGGLDGMNHSHALFQGSYMGMPEVAARANLPPKGNVWAAMDVQPKQAEIIAAVSSKDGGLDYGKFSHHERSGHLTNEEVYKMLQPFMGMDAMDLNKVLLGPATKAAAPAIAPAAEVAAMASTPRPNTAMIREIING